VGSWIENSTTKASSHRKGAAQKTRGKNLNLKNLGSQCDIKTLTTQKSLKEGKQTEEKKRKCGIPEEQKCLQKSMSWLPGGRLPKRGLGIHGKT